MTSKDNTDANSTGNEQETIKETLHGEKEQDKDVKTNEGLKEETEEEDSKNTEETPKKKEGETKPEDKDTEPPDPNELIGKPEQGYDYKDIELPEGYELNKESTEKCQRR